MKLAAIGFQLLLLAFVLIPLGFIAVAFVWAIMGAWGLIPLAIILVFGTAAVLGDKEYHGK